MDSILFPDVAIDSSGIPSARAIHHPATPFANTHVSNRRGATETRLIQFVRITWKWLFAASLISGLVGYLFATKYSAKSYELGARLVFYATQFGSPLYRSPDVHMLLAEFESKETIEELIRKRSLQISPDFLSSQVSVQVRRGSGSAEINLKWPDAEKGKALLDDLVEIGRQRAIYLRDIGVDIHLVGLRDSIVQLHTPNLMAIRKEYDELSKRHGVADIKVAFSDWKAKLDSLESEMRSVQASLEAIEQQDHSLESGKTLISTQVDESTDPTDSSASQVSHSSPTSILNRINELETDISAQRELAVLESRLKSKETELQRIAPLVDRKLMPQSRHSSLTAEVEQLRLAVYGDGLVADMEKERDQLKRQISVYGGDPLSAAKAISDSERLRTQIQTQLLTSQVHMNFLTRSIAGLKPRMEELSDAMPEANAIIRKMELAESQLTSTKELADGLESLKKGQANSFAVIEPAAPTLNSEQSNWRKQFAGAFVLCMLGLSAPVLGVGLSVVKPSPGTRIAERLDVPEIGRVNWSDVLAIHASTSDANTCSDAVRLCAVHLQAAKGSLRNPIFHFVSLTSDSAAIKLVRQMGNCLATFGESVTVVIASETDEVTNQVDQGASSDHATKFVFVGGSRSEDILASISESKRDSDIVLVVGIPLSRRSEVELLSLKADGVVLLAPCGESVSEAASEVVDSLIAFQAPVIGVIS